MEKVPLETETANQFEQFFFFDCTTQIMPLNDSSQFNAKGFWSYLFYIVCAHKMRMHFISINWIFSFGVCLCWFYVNIYYFIFGKNLSICYKPTWIHKCVLWSNYWKWWHLMPFPFTFYNVVWFSRHGFSIKNTFIRHDSF